MSEFNFAKKYEGVFKSVIKDDTIKTYSVDCTVILNTNKTVDYVAIVNKYGLGMPTPQEVLDYLLSITDLKREQVICLKLNSVKGI